ncbi:MAG: gliding motility-associated C-terminal domain-containing protein [Phycisphaerales bacterium]|nr:gliding motility-associated C-terminal domain-containing protein [Phycisphaerales bacterium]
MKKQLNILISIFSLLMCLTLNTKATHIVGGEITYVCLGRNLYKITVTIYRDCLNGIVVAIEDDNPAFISIYKSDGSRFALDTTLNSVKIGGEVIPVDFKNDCLLNPPKTCLNKIVFEKVYFIDNSVSSYKIVYQRCCRNASIINIIDPGLTGATYSCIIPAASAAPCNNSALFKNFPPQIICVNNPLVYDHSATDPDGDSLSYEFCRAYDGGSNNVPKPKPTFLFDAVTYASPYSYTRPMAGSPRIQINPTTGIITGTPNLQGRFVVSVCCHEWRNGVKINTTTREFQFVVTNCSKAVVANIPQLSTEFNTYIVNCKDTKVHFINTSVGGTTYYWDFGVNLSSSDTSTEFEPTFAFPPDSGIYTVTLYVNKGTPCSDSIKRLVKIYPILNVLFSAPSLVCPSDTIAFNDLTVSTYQITDWQWNFDDFTAIDYLQNPKHIYPYGGLYNVGLIVKNIKGCIDTFFKKILVDPFRININKDTTIVKDERIYFQGINGTNYFWTPSTYLSNPNINNPVGYFTDIGTFPYIVEAKSPQSICISKDTVTVRVISAPVRAIPNAFTPNRDGKNDKFRPILVGYQSIRYFRVFNRYGQEMFSTDNIADAWDGTFKGQDQEVGVYYWTLGVKDRFGKDFEEKGDVTLIR